MKKIILLLALSFFWVTGLNAQIQKGNIMIGGAVSDLSVGLQSESDVRFNLMPMAAWFVKDGLALGAYVNFGLLHVGGTEGSSLNYGVGPMGRYYITDNSIEVLKHTRFFLDARVGIDGSNTTKGGSSTNGLGFSLGPGIAYFITPNIGLEGLIAYKGNVGFGSTNYIGNLIFNIGFQIYLPSKQLADAIK